MKNLKVVILLITALTLGACLPVKSTYMLGDYALKTNADEWNGTWIQEKDTFQLKVLNPDFGIIEAASIENGETKKYRMFVTQSENNKYINLVGSDKKFSFVKFKKEKNAITAWRPSKEMLTKAIADQEIKGQVDKDGNILITANSEAVRDFFKTNQNSMMFDHENPDIFKKLVE